MKEKNLTKAQYLAEFEQKYENQGYLAEILKELKKQNEKGKIDFSVDYTRSFTQNVPATIQAQLSQFYVQNLTYVIAPPMAVASEGCVVMNGGSWNEVLQKEGETYIRHYWQDPTYAFPTSRNADHDVLHKTIPGTVSALFRFIPPEKSDPTLGDDSSQAAEAGLELVEVKFSNMALYEFIKNPKSVIHSSTFEAEEHKVDAIIQKAAKAESEKPGPQVITEKQLLEQAHHWEHAKKANLKDVLEKRPENLANIVSMLTDKHIFIHKEASTIQTRPIGKEKDGSVLHRTTIENPFFNVRAEPKFGGVIPGKITIDYKKLPNGKFEFDKMTFSNSALFRFILNPPYVATEEKGVKKLVLTKAAFVEVQEKANDLETKNTETQANKPQTPLAPPSSHADRLG